MSRLDRLSGFPWICQYDAAWYWSATQIEFATDLCFRDAASLQGLYPQFLDHAIRSFHSFRTCFRTPDISLEVTLGEENG